MLILKHPLIHCYSGRSNKRDDTFKTTGFPKFLTYRVVSNSQLLVSYSEQRRITSCGYATNWNSTGYVEFYHPVRKYRMKTS